MNAEQVYARIQENQTASNAANAALTRAAFDMVIAQLLKCTTQGPHTFDCEHITPYVRDVDSFGERMEMIVEMLTAHGFEATIVTPERGERWVSVFVPRPSGNVR